ncbi:MAG: hypothetical protein AAGI51_09375 [Pseudomonadota bacterium]
MKAMMTTAAVCLCAAGAWAQSAGTGAVEGVREPTGRTVARPEAPPAETVVEEQADATRQALDDAEADVERADAVLEEESVSGPEAESEARADE